MTAHARAIVREIVVPATHPALPGHFPGRPIVPAAWLMTLVAGACGDAFGDAGVVTGIAHARFRAPLAPDVPLELELRLRPDGSIAFAARSRGARIFDGILATGAPGRGTS